MTANISATIEIAAPPEQVWAVLADLASFILSPTSGGTQLVQTQTYRGLFTRFPPKTITRIQASFEAINQAVRQRAEDR